jgi:adenylyltransferase/sulfurtransferase
LGSVAATYLAAAGVGKLVLVDKDVVEVSNLNRQILHRSPDVGRLKVHSAAEKLRGNYAGIDVATCAEEISEDNAEEVLEGVDAVVDGLDNFPTRFVLNSYVVAHRLPLFHGAVWGWEGRATTIIPGQTACLRCLYPEVPAEKETFPVVGVAPGLIGVIQATEGIKYFTQTGSLLLNRLLVYDGEAAEFTQVPTERDPRCPVCGDL